MNKEIFNRLVPVIIGSVVGICVVSYGMYLLGWEDAKTAVSLSAIVFFVYVGVQFYHIRKEVIEESLFDHVLYTPLPIVYIESNGLYSKPYLDLNLLDKVWGFALDELFISLRNYYEGSTEKFSFEHIKTSLKKQFLAGKQVARLPTSDELFLIRKEFKKVKAMIMLLNYLEVKTDDWKEDKYICLDDVTDYDSDEYFEKGEKPIEQAFSMNMTEDRNPNKMEFPEHAYVRLVAK